MAIRLSEPVEAKPIAPQSVLREPLQFYYEALLHRLGWPGGGPGEPRTLGVTSALAGEGVSTVAAHLAAVAAASTRREVLLIDSHFQAPSQHVRFRVSLKPGFAELLQSGGDVPTAILASGVPGLSVLPSGKLDGGASRLYDVFELASAVNEISADFDLVVFDLPAVGAGPLSLRMATVLDGVLLVVEAERTRSQAACRALEMLKRAHGRVLGCVLNKRREPQ